MSHDNQIVEQHKTFILAGYTIQCSKIVVAWEFCYQINDASSVTFYPGIWMITGMSGSSSNADYTLVQSNNVTFDQRGVATNNLPCKIFNLSDADQFTAPNESVVGLYSNVQTLLLRTEEEMSIRTFRFTENRTTVTNAGNGDDVNYNIAIRVHLGTVKNYNICK